MTGREYLNRRIHRIRAVQFPVLALFLVALFGAGWGGWNRLAGWVALPACVLLFGAGFYGHWLGLRCPKCRGNLGPLLVDQRRSAANRVQFCPYCGLRLDEELPEAETVTADREGPHPVG